MPNVAARTWRTVLERIEADLIEGRLVPGDRLTPERELATTLGVGRSSVREALRVLEVLGLIRTGTGSGPSAGAIVVATPRGGVSTLMRLHVAAQGFPIDDVLRTRIILETATVAELARAPAPALADAEAALRAMDTPGLTPPEFLALDAAFHLALAEASGNTVVAAVMGGLRDAIEAYVRAAAEHIDDWDTVSAGLRAEHRAIVEAIAAGDPERARSIVHDHITGYYARATTERV